MRKQIVVGNWKLNGSRALCEEFALGLGKFLSRESIVGELAICPPAVYIDSLSSAMVINEVNVAVGAQNVAAQEKGAFTGEMSAAMIKEAGGSYAIVGHSERRAMFGDTDELVATKAAQVVAAGITPIICVGEELAVREAGNHLEFVGQQVSAALSQAQSATLIVAYEPVWAIGTGNTANAAQVQEMHEHIRKVASASVNAELTPILYGGSVNPSNAAELLGLPDVDGALVGGASLELEKFIAIAKR
ncbi:MAG: triose-phosphate isomerase [Gammaproteobacteria bacterium]|nr:triose-phosphate isomerase [Gammaproteobacteria bacterium]NNM11067.1 triose-phosphate isomerase [Pseudomonadales bacterium]